MPHRYWVTFVPIGRASPLDLGCGVTAGSWREAREMIRTLVFPLFGEREIVGMLQDVDVGSLDAGHVLPNMGNAASTGIWFPAIRGMPCRTS